MASGTSRGLRREEGRRRANRRTLWSPQPNAPSLGMTSSMAATACAMEANRLSGFEARNRFRSRTSERGAPGSILAAGKLGIDVACGTGCLRLLTIQLPGGKRLSAADFLNARSVDGVVLE